MANARMNSKKAKWSNCAGSPSRDIMYVNGINSTHTDLCKSLNEIAKSTCGTVTGVYNSTHGLIPDLAESSQDKGLIELASLSKYVPQNRGRNPAVDTMTDLIKSETDAGRRPEIWAHSQGAAIASVSLYQARNLALIENRPDPIDGLTVKTFGGAAQKLPKGPKYQNFIHVDDITPTTVGLGPTDRFDHADRDTEMIRFSGEKPPFGDGKRYGVPRPAAYHDMDSIYLKMEEQKNPRCSCGRFDY